MFCRLELFTSNDALCDTVEGLPELPPTGSFTVL